jgi:hypothetical protein
VITDSLLVEGNSSLRIRAKVAVLDFRNDGNFDLEIDAPVVIISRLVNNANCNIQMRSRSSALRNLINNGNCEIQMDTRSSTFTNSANNGNCCIELRNSVLHQFNDFVNCGNLDLLIPEGPLDPLRGALPPPHSRFIIVDALDEMVQPSETAQGPSSASYSQASSESSFSSRVQPAPALSHHPMPSDAVTGKHFGIFLRSFWNRTLNPTGRPTQLNH